MNGLTLSRSYYEKYGREMIRRLFPKYESRIAVGLVGEGSECFGFDDQLSEDHDFGPGFCLWLSGDDKEMIGQELQEAYLSLPKSFQGYAVKRDNVMSGHRIGVWEIGEFYYHFLGVQDVPEPSDSIRWLLMPETSLATATNGMIFRDDLGAFTRIRNGLKNSFPEDVRIKKMTARMAVMSQAGQYNYPRCLERDETVGAAIALVEFMKAAMSMVYWLNRRYAPYYKWTRKGLTELECLSFTADWFDALAAPERDSRGKQGTIDLICMETAKELHRQGLTDNDDPFLQGHLATVTEHIQDDKLRNLHWMEG